MKKVLLSIPTNNGIYDVIRHNLEEAGIECVVMPLGTCHQFKYPNQFIRFLNFLSKTFFRFNFKSILISRARKKWELIHFRQKYDLLLAIRPDLMTLEQIRLAKSVCRKLVGYQWDGLERFPDIYKYIDYFDDFYVFDKNDLTKKPKLKFKTNFRLKPFDEDFKFTLSDAHFIGEVDLHRYSSLVEIANHLTGFGLRFIFYITKYPRGVVKKHPSIRVRNNPRITYNQNLLIAKSTKVIVDINDEKLHTGLSLRFFEAMELRKKLITTNIEIREYDFYHPNNIYIHGFSGISIAEFMSLPYCEIDCKITDKYKIEEWIKEFLD